jgi:hypothetical protein
MIIGFGVVAVALVAGARGRLNYERLQDAPSVAGDPNANSKRR